MTAAAIGALVGRRKSRLDPEHPTDPVRSHSYDVEDARAKVARRIGDGSAGYGWSWCEALRHAAVELYREHYDQDFQHQHAMQRSYLDVLEAVLGFLDYRTGELIAPYTAIAAKAVVSTTCAKKAIAALEYWGFLGHVRRSVKVDGAEGGAGPQRQQAPNAYFFDCRRRMPASTWGRFWSRLLFNLRKLGDRAAAARKAVLVKHSLNEVARQAPRAGGELGAILARIERDHFGPAAAGPSPSPA